MSSRVHDFAFLLKEKKQKDVYSLLTGCKLLSVVCHFTKETSMNKNKLPILIIGSSDDMSDLFYATKIKTSDPIILLITKNAKYIVVSDFETERVHRIIPSAQIMSPSMLQPKAKKRKGLDYCAVALLKRLNISKVYVPWNFPTGPACTIQKAGIHIYPIRSQVFPERAVKNADELHYITETQQSAVIAMQKAIELIRKAEPDDSGYLRIDRDLLSSEQVREVIRKTLFELNCLARDVIVSCGADSAEPHEIGQGPLRCGEPIVIDIFPQHIEHRYWGDLTRTVVRGTASSELRRMYSAVKKAQQETLNKIKAGVSCSTIDETARCTFEKLGYKTYIDKGRRVGFIHSTGHGVGLCIHENPSLSPNSKEILQEGNVVTVEPGLYYPQLGGIRIEDTVLVTKHGWRYLAPCEKKFNLYNK